MNVASDTLTEENSAAAESKTPNNRAGRKMPRLSQHGIGENLRTGVYWIARLWFRGVFYGRTLRGRRRARARRFSVDTYFGGQARTSCRV